MRTRRGAIRWLAILLLLPHLALAHDDDRKPKTPSKAAQDLKWARQAMDAYKTRLQSAGRYGCCIKKPLGARTAGCDVCAKVNGSCQCGANLAQGKGVCGECYGAWKAGRGEKAFGKVNLQTLKVLDSSHQGREGQTPEETPERRAYTEAMTQAKRTLLSERRYACCVGKGGCDECAYETYCGCAANLVKDREAKPNEKKRGVCGQCLDGQHGGLSRVGNTDLEAVTLSTMEGERMSGALGPYPMSREGSGTSWLPESSPLYGRMRESGRWHLMQMGLGFAAYTESGGTRNEHQFFTPTQGMLMAQTEVGGGTLALRGMLSLDPLLIGKRGYPNLFQTGETYLGGPLKDRQHPHDLMMELSASYAKPLAPGVRGFLYLAPAGEPALGMAAFSHRPSAWDNPISPITHHWFDGTHITYGVATAGVILGSQWKVEGSLFTGREPDENRYDIDPLRFDSASGRLTYNPNPYWSLQGSYAFLKQPETLEPGNAHRWILSAQYNRPLARQGNFAALLAYGQTAKSDHTSDAWLGEVAWMQGRITLFGRYENVLKDELVGVPAGEYRVQKWTLGGVYNFQQDSRVEQGIGAGLDFYAFPAALHPFYGNSPVSFTLFYRLRFGRQ